MSKQSNSEIVSQYEQAENDIAFYNKRIARAKRDITECDSLLESIKQRRAGAINVIDLGTDRLNASKDMMKKVTNKYADAKTKINKRIKIQQQIEKLEKDITILKDYHRL